MDEGGSDSSPAGKGGEVTMNWKRGLLVLFALVVLSGCATMPTGPTVTVMPGPGKPFEVFMADDGVCRQWAQQQIGGASPSETANQNTATGAVVGTLVGAGMGAAIGAATGNAGAGAAAIGGGAGLLGGTAIGSNAGAASEYQLQRRYDIAYQQCMYAKGNQIPGVVRQPARAYTHHHRHPRRVTVEVHGSRYRVSTSMANGYPNIGCRYHRVPESRSRLQGHPLRNQALTRRHLLKDPDEERGMRAF